MQSCVNSFFIFFCPTDLPTFTRGRAMGNETFYGDGLILVSFSWRVFNLVSPKLIQKDCFLPSKGSIDFRILSFV